jgi:hypothetical protein
MKPERPSLLHIRRLAIERLINQLCYDGHNIGTQLLRIRIMQDKLSVLTRGRPAEPDPLSWVDTWRPSLSSPVDGEETSR